MDELKEKYLQGKMTDAEQKAFESGLSGLEKEELAGELGIRAGLESGFRNELRKTVAGFEHKKPRVRKMYPAYISVAASVLIAASVVFYFTTNNQSLFDQYYQPYPNYEVTTLRGADLTSREKAYSAYDAEDYIGALASFDVLETLSMSDYFFRGICHIQLRQYDRALNDLNLVASGDNEYSPAAKWYAALIYLELKNEAKATDLLKSLSKSASAFSASAIELLDKL
tara:strand:- start:364 stop:1044 length:681 start_codon:yes stop_codon:yes gene_type:complete